MIPLSTLDAHFLKITKTRDDGSWAQADMYATFGDCDGVEFLCPLCYTANGGPRGTHGVICWKPHVPQVSTPGPGRWAHQGSGMHDLSLVAGSSSILLKGGCGWHGFVQNGHALGDLDAGRVAQVRAMLGAPPTEPTQQETPMDDNPEVEGEQPKTEPEAVSCKGGPREAHTWAAEPVADNPFQHRCIVCGDTLTDDPRTA